MVLPSHRGGRESVSVYHVLQRYSFFSLLEVLPKTGRTHQIRVHLAHISHPVFGDPTYGGRSLAAGPGTPAQKAEVKRLLGLIPRQALHAKTIGFQHPVTGQPLLFDSPLPADMQAVLSHLRGEPR